jgi:tetratricopeptide (TPR) repeat protein
MFPWLRGAALIVALCCLTSETGVAQSWTAIRLPNFLFIGDVTDRQLRSVVDRLDEFRAALERGLAGLVTKSPAPTVVVVFKDVRTMRPYQPFVLGEFKNVEGYFRPDEDINFIAMTADGRALEVVFHEYVHFLLDNTIGETPTWYGEGMAQMYQTLAFDRTRTFALVGAPPAGQLALLRKSPLVPLQQLMEVKEPWETYHDTSSRGVFYAQSWILVHYLHLGNRARAGQLGEYLEHVQRGETFEQAFAAAFKSEPAVLEAELQTYIRTFTSSRLRIDLGQRLADRPGPAPHAIDADEVHAYLGDLLSRTGHVGDARERLERLLESHPDNARAAAALGSLDLRSSRFETGLALLERAATLRPDDGPIQTALGIALYDLAQRQWDQTTLPETFQRARTTLKRAVTLNPDIASAHLALGNAEMVMGDHDSALESIGRAIALAPARKEYVLARARVLIQQRAYDRAEAELRPLVISAPAIVRAAARSMLDTLTNERQAGTLAFAGAPPTRALGTSGMPALRPLREGEQAVVGQLMAVDCRAALSLYQVQTESGDLRLNENLGGVQLTSFRRDAPAAIGCGPIANPPRVRVTYRPSTASPGPGGAAASHGTAIAIEFIPDWFAPR